MGRGDRGGALDLEVAFRAAVERSPDIIGIHRAGRMVYMNPTGLTTLGWEAAELLGRSVYDIVDPADHPIVSARIEHMAVTGNAAPLQELRLVRKDGRSLTAEVVAVPAVVDGEACIVAIARDVTDRKLMEARLLQADRLVSLGTLAAGVAHEINNPLTYILANTEWLARELDRVVDALRDPASQKTSAELLAQTLLMRLAVERTMDGWNRICQIVRDLRVFSRADSDELGPVDLNATLETAIKLAWHEIRHRALLVRDFGDVPVVDANEGRLSQAFLNLLVNAAQAIPEGAADTNSIHVRSTTSSSGECVVEISDTGLGIPRELRSRIFDPFYTTKPLGLGQGLGLSITHGVITSYGGRIEVDDGADGRGTLFRAFLPAGGTPHRRPMSSSPPSSSPGRRGRVLVVDDEPRIGESLALLLGEDHDLTSVTGARDALQLIERGERYDVILCDLMMPVMTGIDLFEALDQRCPDQAARVVFLSGGVSTPHAAEFIQRFGARLLEKPLDVDKLRAVIKKHVKRPASGRREEHHG
jgi:PAS domain S-box-containing protein